MNFSEMSVLELQERKKAIASEIDAEGADLDVLDEEVRGIKEELDRREAEANKKAELRSLVASDEKAGSVIESMPKTEERANAMLEKKDIKEFRNSKEYIDLYAEFMKSGDDTEIRAALLTTNAESGGSIAVPDFVYDIIKTAWDKNDIMNLVPRANVKGNWLVNFEVSGSDAVWHKEGSGAVTEEELTEGIIKIVPEYAKKWKSFSKTVLAMRGEAFVRYIYDEITYRIIKLLADTLIEQIAELPQTATETTPSAALISEAPALGTVAKALGELSDEASNPVIVMNKKTWAAFKAVQYAGNYAVDPFEGYDVHFSNKLPDYATATGGQVYMIVGDFREGTIANFPNGESVEFTFDTISRKKENLVEVLGELYVGTGVVADKAFALVAKVNG